MVKNEDLKWMWSIENFPVFKHDEMYDDYWEADYQETQKPDIITPETNSESEPGPLQ